MVDELTVVGERTGLITFVTKSSGSTRTINSILENVQRATLSSPAVYGARIASVVLNTFSAQWAEDLKTMSKRIRTMREVLYEELSRLETPGDWSHIVQQSGMFGYTGLSTKHIRHLQGKECAIWMFDAD